MRTTCGHPPFADRCWRCDARVIPVGTEIARTTPVWTASTVPPALRSAHATSAWAELLVERGTVVFVEDDTGWSATAKVGRPVVIVPGRHHHIEPSDDARFAIRFYRLGRSGGLT